MHKINIKYFFLILYTILIFADQRLYRYGIIIDIGTTWRVIDAAVLIFISLHLLTLWKKSNGNLKDKILKINLFLYIILLVIATARGFQKEGMAAIGLARYSLLEMLLIPIFLGVLIDKKKILNIIRMATLTVFSVVVIKSILNINEFSVLFNAQEEGRFVDSYTVCGVASVFLILLPFSILRFKGKFNQEIKIYKNKTMLILLISFLIIIQVRSVWIATFAGILVAFFVVFLNSNKNVNHNDRQRIFIGILTLCLIIIISVQMFPTFFSHLFLERLKFLRNIETDTNGYWRILSWRTSIEETLKNNFMFGNGFIGNVWMDKGGNSIYVWEHNQYVFLFRTMGLVGVICYVALLVNTARIAIQTLSKAKGIGKMLIIGLVSAFIANTVYMIFYMQPVFIVFIMVLILALSNIEEKFIKIEKKP